MKTVDEATRLCALQALQLLDTPPEPAYDGLVALAARLAGAPAAVLTLVDADRQWFKARVGLSAAQTARAGGFCAYTIEHAEGLVVEDARQDPRFARNPIVCGDPHVTFYAGVPLVLAGGERVGALAVIDWAPRQAGPELMDGLRLLADQAVALFELRRERRQHAETAARLSQAQAVARVGIWELDLGTRRLSWSDEVYRIFGVAPQSFGADFDAFMAYVHEDDRPRLLAVQAPAEAGRAPLDVGHRIVRADGSVRHVRERAELVPAREGRGAMLVGTVLDVTDEVEARLAAEAGQAQLASALDSLRLASHLGRLGAWAVDLATGQLQTDPEVNAIFGHGPDDVLGVEQTLGQVLPDDREALRAAFEACCTDGTPYDRVQRIVDRQGNERWTRAIGMAQRDEAGRIVRVRGAFQDIDEPTRLTEDLQRLGRRLAHTLERMGDAFYLLDRDWRFQYFNHAAETALGRPRERVLGVSLWALFPDLVGTRLETEYRRALERQQACQFEYHWQAGERWFDVHAFPTDDGLAVHFRDVTEPRRLAEQLRQSQKLESLGQLTGGVAHDFNNLLTVIQGNAELLAESAPQSARERALATMILAAAQRGSELTRRLLAFARRQALEPRAVDLGRLVTGLEPLLRRTLGEPVEIEHVRGDALWPALVDPGQLETALLNLAINARDAMPSGGRLTFETANVHIDASDAASHHDLGVGPYVLLTVSDTGCGIAAADLPRVFEPFFTTKETGKGTGLGLPMVYGFVKQSGGHVTIDSAPGRGTVVRLYLPRAAGATGAPSPRAAAEAFDGGQRLVLVVEDEPMVREFAAELLRQLGFRVVEADDAEAALRLLHAHADVSLLFTDVVMPGRMNGRDLADAARALRPALPVLYTSGYAESAIVHEGRLDAGVSLLGKPYRRAELVRKLREVLGSAGAASP